MALAPPADLRTSVGMVRALLSAQAPTLADLPVTELAHGWDNDVYRLGDGLVVRLPRRRLAVELLENEVRWLPTLAPSLTVRTPQPVFVGAPSNDFPRPWSVVEHVPGTAVTSLPVPERTALATDQADFLAALHEPAAPHAPVNPVRGGSLAHPESDARVRARLARLAEAGHAALADELLPRWEAWVNAPDHDGADVWLHGDLHPHNMVAAPDGRLAGVIDWGDLTAGDPACDLATAWLTFDASGRRALVERIGPGGPLDAHTWTRAKAWALHLGLALATSNDDQPDLAGIGHHALAELATEPV